MSAGKASELLGRSYAKLVAPPQRGHLARRFLKRARHLQTEPALEERKIYLLDGRKGDAAAVVTTLEEFAAAAASQNLDVRPLEELR